MERKSFLIVPKEVLENKNLSAREVLLLALLKDYQNKRTGQCNPRRATLAEKLRVSEPTITRAIANLRKCGLLDSIRTTRGRKYEFPTNQKRSAATNQKRSAPTNQNDPSIELDLMNYKRTPASRASAGAAAASRVARKPAASAGSSDLTLVAESLRGLAQEAHLPPPDEAFIRLVAAAAPGATGEQIHRALVNLWKSGHLRNMRGWGFILVKLGDYFREGVA